MSARRARESERVCVCVRERLERERERDAHGSVDTPRCHTDEAQSRELNAKSLVVCADRFEGAHGKISEKDSSVLKLLGETFDGKLAKCLSTVELEK